MEYRRWVCNKPSDITLERSEIYEIDDNEVLIKVDYCGICHSDIHIIDGDWNSRGFVNYPLTPGHEVIGKVVKKGKNVDKVDINDIVGLPWVHSSCLDCEYCLSSNEQFCENRKITGINTIGGYSEYCVLRREFAIPVNKLVNIDNWKLEEIAPLYCAGLTTYTALKKLNIKPMMRVAILGLGGLGHMAVQYSRTFGAYTIVFSSDISKKKLAEKLGADQFLTYDEIEKVGKLDIVLSTLPNSEIAMKFIPYLKAYGKISFVGAHINEISFQPISLISKNLVLTGNAVGSRIDLIETIKLSISNNLKPMVETFEFHELPRALEIVRKGKAKLRAVLKVS
ncbi:MAG: NAD(P)-dependent alcohol dehydrogenase [Candidatus Calescibacterium sp.]|nr:NAD(P)-dependent alcohol dehydrogenase [Candidatus Calescibacterium sp.]MDW8132188.1 NAD(P)-dependent alcohol dehydrogenase [Candidatus Calescibacterium sp.]